MLAIESPYPQYFDLDGSPLNAGQIYFGQPNQNPETAPITVYWDAAGTQPTSQPITTQNGYIVRSGSPAIIYAAGDYSVTVRDSQRRLVTYSQNSAEFGLASSIQGLATDLADTVSAAKGGGLVGYNPALAYPASTVGRRLHDLDAANGADTVGFTQLGTGAVERSLGDRAKDTVSVFDFMTAAQIADVRANTAATNLAAALDVTAAIQFAIYFAASRSVVGGEVYMPPGSYKISATIYTYGDGGASGQIALVGSGQFSTRIFPSGDFTAINDISGYLETGGFSIEWPITAWASIPTSRVGIELASGEWQGSYATKRAITVSYAYRGFVLNDWTAQPLGTIYLIKMRDLTAFRCADWGIYINSKVGSTTTIMEHCYVRGDNSVSAPVGKGIFVNNVDDVLLLNCAVDQCLDNWIKIQNASTLNAISTAFEGCKMASATAFAFEIAASSAIVSGIKTISCLYSTGGNARVLAASSNTFNMVISGYSEQAATISGGTTRYKAVTSSAVTHIQIMDRTILPADVLDNGFFANVVYEGLRRSSLGLAPNYGAWVRGDYVKNGAPAVASAKGWYCTASGSPGTWVSEGNL